MPLRTIGKYELLEEIGRGGFAVVYKARDTTLDRVVALKILYSQWATDPQFAMRFRQEARAAANLRHPHIVPVYDTGEADGQLYIAMAYLPGRTLHDVLEADGPLTLEQALPILEQLADALDYAHAQGVVHRDLKPINVMVEDTPRGPVATLMDFGLIKMLESSTALTSQGTLLGSPEYMAPEQADPNRHAEIGPATDRYALGILTYRMLAGRVPFPGNTPGTLNAHLNLDVPDPRRFVQDLPQKVTTTLLKMLAKAPTDRFPTAGAFVEALRQVLAGRPATTFTPATQSHSAPVSSPAPLPTELRSVLVGVVVALFAIGLFCYVTPILWRWEDPSGIPTVTDTATLTPTAVPSPTAPLPAASTPEPPTNTPEPPTFISTLTPELPTLTPTHTPEPPTLTPTSTPEPKPTIDTFHPPVCATAGATWTRPSDEMTLVCVPGGTFKMGSNDGGSDEQPVHSVTLSAFWIDQTEVTVAQFRRFAQAEGYKTEAEKRGESYTYTGGSWSFVAGANWQHPSGPTSSAEDDHPVVHVSWNDAQAYCTWAGAQLPTETQWEYAARGMEERVYPWGNDFDETKLNYCDKNCSLNWADKAVDDGYEYTAPVGNFPAGKSWAGALDLAGNVFEWTADWYAAKYSEGAQTNPTGPGTGYHRVLRGGSWHYDASNVRSTNRTLDLPTSADDSGGFRCVVVRAQE